MPRLSDIRAEWQRTMLVMDAGYQRDMALGQLMSKLERDHSVPVMQSLAAKDGDTPALALWREISDSRWMLQRS